MQAPIFAGSRFSDRFELKSQAGTGGMGTVYQAVDRQSGEVVAVKVLHGKGSTDAARFAQEAALLAELSHPGIVRYIDHGETSHHESYIAMEWLAGETLEERLRRGPLTPGAVALVASRVLLALAAAHSKGVIHRDIKPSNVFLLHWKCDDVRILDFGIARRMQDPKRFTKMGSTVGTPMYTAPEQARGDRTADFRVDIFSLGCVIFECLSGEPPFNGDSPMAVMAKICMGDAPHLRDSCPGLPLELETLVDRMIAQDRTKRPGDAGALAQQFAVLAQQIGTGIEAANDALGSDQRHTLGAGEQRTLAALMVSTGQAGDEPPNRHPAKRILPWQGATAARAISASASVDQVMDGLTNLVGPLGGHVDRLLDGSLTITLSILGPLSEQAQQLAQMALLIKSQLPLARMALGCGRAVLLAHLPVGAIVETLAELLIPAAAGEIRVDETSARLLRNRFVLGEAHRGHQLLRGRDEATSEVGGASPGGGMLGRERELGTLQALFDNCADEEVARAAIVTGHPGLGKTTLAQALAERVRGATRPPTVLLATCSSARAGSPLGALSPLLELARVAPAPGSSASGLAQAMIGWFKTLCSERPVLVILDELQWGDQTSLQILDAALRELRDLPFMVCAFGRPEMDDNFPALWAERHPERLRLTPLSRKVGQTLLARLFPGVPEATETFILERWEGNPFFLQELAVAAQGGLLEVPETVLAVVETRLDALGPECKRVLRAASLFGETFATDGLVAVMGEHFRHLILETTALLVERDVIRRLPGDDGPGGGQFIFRHPLVRDVAVEMLPPPDRAIGNRLARVFLEQIGRTLPECLSAAIAAH